MEALSNGHGGYEAVEERPTSRPRVEGLLAGMNGRARREVLQNSRRWEAELREVVRAQENGEEHFSHFGQMNTLAMNQRLLAYYTMQAEIAARLVAAGEI